MEKLINDVKELLMQNLSSKDIGRLAQTSKTMYKILYSDRFISFWKNRIMKEFHIDYKGDDTFVTYKFYERKNRKCKYTMTRGRNMGGRCYTRVLDDGTLGSDRYCRECLHKTGVKYTLAKKEMINQY